MNVRSATPADVEQIKQVARDSWETDYPDILSRETVESGFDNWYGTEQVERAIEDPLTIVQVAVDDETVVGFAHAVLDGNSGVVLRLYVHPDNRRDGLGRTLCDETTARLRDHDVGQMRAMVLAENEPGNQFYRQLGFEQVDSAETTIAGDSFTENTYQQTLEG